MRPFPSTDPKASLGHPTPRPKTLYPRLTASSAAVELGLEQCVPQRVHRGCTAVHVRVHTLGTAGPLTLICQTGVLMVGRAPWLQPLMTHTHVTNGGLVIQIKVSPPPPTPPLYYMLALNH